MKKILILFVLITSTILTSAQIYRDEVKQDQVIYLVNADTAELFEYHETGPMTNFTYLTMNDNLEDSIVQVNYFINNHKHFYKCRFLDDEKHQQFKDYLGTEGYFVIQEQYFRQTRLKVGVSPNVEKVKQLYPKIYDHIYTLATKYETGLDREIIFEEDKIFINEKCDFFMSAYNKYYNSAPDEVRVLFDEWITEKENGPANEIVGIDRMKYKWGKMDHKYNLDKKIREQHLDPSKKPSTSDEMTKYKNRNNATSPNMNTSKKKSVDIEKGKVTIGGGVSEPKKK